MRRHIILSCSDYLASGPNLVKLLRTAIGLACSYKRPRVSVVLLGDAVRCARSCAHPEWTRRYLRSADIHQVELWVEEESLTSRQLKLADMTQGCESVSSSELADRWLSADLQVRI